MDMWHGWLGRLLKQRDAEHYIGRQKIDRIGEVKTFRLGA
jgi:hypothetical protein